MPFEGGRPAGDPVDVLTGFVDDEGEARGRPVGVAIDAQGALLVADDVGNRIWRLSAAPRGGWHRSCAAADRSEAVALAAARQLTGSTLSASASL